MEQGKSFERQATRTSTQSNDTHYTLLSADMGVTSPPPPPEVNIHQFYPELEHNFSNKSAQLAVKQRTETSTYSDKGQTNEEVTSEKSSQYLGSSEDKKDTESTSVFSTAVDPENIEAAKQRYESQKGELFEPETWTPTRAPNMTMDQVIDGKVVEHYVTGMAHMEAREFEAATISFTKALNLKPKSVQLYIQRAESYLHMCDYKSAILNYKKACVLEPDNQQYYSRLAFIYYFQGQCLFDQKLFHDALEAFSRAAEMRPDIIGYHTISISCLAALQRHGECLALVNKRLEMDQDSADLFIMRARLHELFRNVTLAYYDIKDALCIDPDHVEASRMMLKLQKQAEDLHHQAMQLNILGRFRDALQKISLAIETNPAVAKFHVLRGALHRRLSDFNSAIDDYLLALDKTDHNEESPVYQSAQRQLLLTYNDFAVECFTKEFYEEAVILLNKAIKGEKNEKGLYINRGDCFFRQNELNFAVQDYHQAFEMDQSDDSVRARIAVIHNEYGILDFQEKNFQDAESRFTLAIQHNPRVGHFYMSRCRARQMMETVEGARSDLVMAMLLDPENQELLSMMTRLYPGKSVSDVMRSKTADKMRVSVQGILPLVQEARLSEDKGTSQVTKLRNESDFKICMHEREFHLKIAQEKKKINVKVKKALNQRKTLRHDAARLLPLPDPVATKATSSSTGWRQFGITLGTK